jgi:hypothetical protein
VLTLIDVNPLFELSSEDMILVECLLQIIDLADVG